MNHPVFNPADFRLLRKACPRYDTKATSSATLSRQRRKESPPSTGASLVGGRLTYLGPGCYRTLTGIRSNSWS